MKKPKKQTTVFYESIVADYDVIWAYLDEEYIALNKVAARLPVPLRVEKKANPRGHKGSVGEVVEASVKTIWQSRERIVKVIWQELSDAYMAAPRAEKVQVGDHEEWRNVGNTGVNLSDEVIDLMNELALYMRRKGYSVPRMLRGGVASPRVISAVAVIYTSRFYIPEMRRDNALGKFK